ncbi:MAG: diadenylate cyclase, partial [Pseudomonadota bacterium]
MAKVILFLMSIRWQDVVDITLNSYIIFRLYALLRGTNAFRVLIGIALLWFFQRLSDSLGLIVTSWAIQGITAVAALIIVVVFRNEIRSVLQAKNLKSIFWGFPRSASETPVEILVESAFELARRQVGALIVLPGNEDLTESVHSGIGWQGLVSNEMILSIFWHDNPVHDGAAIVQGDRITEVGVILPLSHREDLPSHYGTRHRAAAGLAELTDALVIVVSEESGKVSVAKGRSLSAMGHKGELSEILEQHVGISRKQRSPVKKKRIELGMVALVSFLLIVGVWFSLTRGLDTLMTIEVPIDYMNRDPGMEILGTSKNTVSLEVNGSGALIRSIRPEQVNVRLDLSKAVVGANAFKITPDNVSLPPGIRLNNIGTPMIVVTLDMPVTKDLPVQVDWVGKLPEHLIISEVEIDPKTVQVTAGSRILKDVSTIYTEKVSVDRPKKTGEMTA